MTLLIDQANIDRFRTVIARRLGLQYDNGRVDFLADVLRQRVEATKCRHFDDYAEFLASSPARSEEFRVLAEQLTVVETFFFRNADNFRAFTEHVLPERVRANARMKRLRILSAGCASGDEPYSLAILLREALPDLASWDVQIVGVDVNPAMLRKATLARYTAWSLRATPEDFKRRYFRPDGRDFVLDPAIRNMVTLSERNLIDDDPSFWRSLTYDVVFCRNVLMYFIPEVMQQIVERLNRCLVPDGFLFLGHAETLRGISQGFHLCHTHDTFYYQRRGESDSPAEADTSPPFPIRQIADTPSVAVEAMAPWVEIIQRASAHIASLRSSRLDRSTGLPADGESTTGSGARSWDLALVLDAMRRERFSDALLLLSALPSDAHEVPDTMLLRAALLTNCGRLEDAEETCDRLIALDELNAGAHYIKALCREHAGDLSGTVEHDQIAIYLDAAFAMPHLHLGLVSRRCGDVAAAQRELAQAMVLLAREDSSRLLLFGGGFSRETLLQLCRTGLRASGGGDR